MLEQRLLVTVKLKINDDTPTLLDLNIDIEKLSEFAVRVLSGESITTSGWAGPSSLFTRNEFEVFRSKLLTNNLIAYRNSRFVREGFVLTKTGEAFFNAIKDSNYEQEVINSETTSIDGYLYVITYDDIHVKIGITNDVVRRINALQTACPQKIRILAIVQTDRPRALERKLHKLFGDKKTQGEWFELGKGDVEYLKNLNAHIRTGQIPLL